MFRRPIANIIDVDSIIPSHVSSLFSFKQKRDAFAQLMNGIRSEPRPKPVEQRVLNGRVGKSNTKFKSFVSTVTFPVSSLKVTAMNSVAVIARFDEKRCQFIAQLFLEKAVQFQRDLDLL